MSKRLVSKATTKNACIFTDDKNILQERKHFYLICIFQNLEYYSIELYLF